jgi:hypothetical protein
MIYYVKYDPTTGVILGQGYGTPPSGVAYIEVAGRISTNGQRVDPVLKQVVPKPRIPVSAPSSPVEADGVAEAVISGIPIGTQAVFYVSGSRVDLSVNDGSLELALHEPQHVQVRLYHPVYEIDPVELEFV